MFLKFKTIKKISEIFSVDIGINKKKKKNLILLEFYNYYPSIIGFAYFLQILKQINKAEVVCYKILSTNLLNNIYTYFFFHFSFIKKLYQAIGVNEFLFIKNNIPKKKLEKEFLVMINKIKTKHDVINLKCLGVDVGQEIYDEYLRIYNKTEVDIYDKNFKKLLIRTIQNVFYWKCYFFKNNIKVIIISHATYFIALPGRVASYFNIPVYTVAASNFYLIKKNSFSKEACCKKLAYGFKNISENKSTFLKLAKVELLSRFDGVKDSKALQDQEVNQILFDKKISFSKIINDTKKINILVAAHCFSDGVHAFGKFFYTDYHDWLTFLGEVSHNQKYQFYIKIHPAEYNLNYKHFLKFQNKYNFKILPKKLIVSHMLKEKFDYVLTAYGSVGHEYPLYNVPVINASNNGPHSGYNFNINPKNRMHYEKIIINLKKNQFKINSTMKKKIFEFYFMKYLSEYCLLDGANLCMKILKHEYNSFKVVQYFLDTFKMKNHKQKLVDVENFIKSKSLRPVVDNKKNVSRLLTYLY
jgi:hypothetical protein